MMVILDLIGERKQSIQSTNSVLQVNTMAILDFILDKWEKTIDLFKSINK